MTNLIKYSGKIHYDPANITKKHQQQASWKRVAMILFDGDICEYYAWFIKKRFGLILNKPIRNAHITFINDSLNDMGLKNGKPIDEIERDWVKNRNTWHGKTIDVILNTNIQSNGKHYWLIVDHDHREPIHNIRREIGLEKPFFGLHLSIGYSNERQIEDSHYVSQIINNKNLFI